MNYPTSVSPVTTANNQSGFTLIELMLAMAIFALLAATGWQVFDSMNRSQTRAKPQLEALTQLQFGYGQIQRDMRQLVPYHVGNINANNTSPTTTNATLTQGSESSQSHETAIILNNGVQLNNNVLSFVRYRDPDPRYQQTSALERIVYRFEQDKLIRQRYADINVDLKNIDRVSEEGGFSLNKTTTGINASNTSSQVPIESVLVDGVSNGQFNVLLPEPSIIYPNPQSSHADRVGAIATAQNSQVETPDKGIAPLPLGVAINFNIMLDNTDTPIDWIYALNNSPPIIEVEIADKASESTNEGSNNGSGSNENSNSGSTTGTESNPDLS